MASADPLYMPTSGQPLVLVVDDYVDATEVWSLYLRATGFDVETADDGLVAIERALALRPDIIVMDLNLPGCSGIEVARALRADEHARAIPLIAATGCADRRELDTARVARMDFPLRFTPERFPDFGAWRSQARATLL